MCLECARSAGFRLSRASSGLCAHNAGADPRPSRPAGPAACSARLLVSSDGQSFGLQHCSGHREEFGPHPFRDELTTQGVAASAGRADVVQREGGTTAGTWCLMVQFEAERPALACERLERGSPAPAAAEVTAIQDDSGPQPSSLRSPARIAQLGVESGARKQQADVPLLKSRRRRRPPSGKATAQLVDEAGERGFHARRILGAGPNVAGRPPCRQSLKLRVALRQLLPSRTRHPTYLSTYPAPRFYSASCAERTAQRPAPPGR